MKVTNFSTLKEKTKSTKCVLNVGMTKKMKWNQIYTAQKHCMQYAKASCCFGQQPSLPPTHRPNNKSVFTEDPSTQHCPSPTTHIRSYIQNITKHDYVTKPVSLEKGEALWNSNSSPSSVREGRQGLGTVVPLVRLGIVHLHLVQELVSVKAAHSVDGVAQHGHTSIAAWRCHATQHPPLITGRVVHLHTAKCMGAIEAANNKQFACTQREISQACKTVFCKIPGHPNTNTIPFFCVGKTQKYILPPYTPLVTNSPA